MGTQQREQTKRNIIVLYDFSASAQHALKHGLKMCYVLKAGLTLVYPAYKSDNPQLREKRKNEIKTLLTQLQNNHPFEIQAFAPDKPFKKFFKPLYEKIEGIMIVVGIVANGFVCDMSMRLFLKLVRQSRIPWLAVPEHTVEFDYNHVILPLTYTRQTKEKIAWASYFHRLNKSAIHALVPKGKDGFIRMGIYKNTEFLKKMYGTIDAYYKLIQTDKSIHDIDAFALEYATEHSAAPVIITVSPRPDLFDLILGSTERSIIMNKHNIPVLCINPLDDMYVVCS